MAKTYTKTRVKATEAMLLISKADRILAKDRMKLGPRKPGDQNATMLHALVAREIAIRQGQAHYVLKVETAAAFADARRSRSS